MNPLLAYLLFGAVLTAIGWQQSRNVRRPPATPAPEPEQPAERPVLHLIGPPEAVVIDLTHYRQHRHLHPTHAGPPAA